MPEERLSREEQKELTKKKILDTAVEILLDPDFSSLNTNELAEKAEVSKGIIFHHFGSKDNLFLEAFKAIYSTQLMQNPINEEASSYEKLREFTKMNIEFIQSHVNLNSLLIQYISSMSSQDNLSDLQQFMLELGGDTMEALAPVFLELGWDKSDIENISFVFFAILDGIGLHIEIFRNFPENPMFNLEIDPLVDTIMTLFDRRKQNESDKTTN